MVASMQSIAVALFVVAFVPASVPAQDLKHVLIDGYVSDLYSATDHTLVGSFNYTDNGYAVDVEVNEPLHFASKYPYVAVILHRAEDVSARCRPDGPALIDREGTPLAIYSGKYTGIHNTSDYTVNLQTSLSPNAKSTIVNSVVVMYSANAKDPKPSPIACGKIRHISSTDDFLEGYNIGITLVKPTDLPTTSNRGIPLSMLHQVEAVTDLYSADDGKLAGSLIYRTFAENSLEVGVLDFSGAYQGAPAVAVVYNSEDVMPGCVTIGPALAVRDELNVTRPVALFMDGVDDIRKPIYGNVVDYASVSPRSDFDIMGRVVVVYISISDSPIVVDDFLQTNVSYMPFACGVIRSADTSEDNFLKWAPAGVKPTPISETKKWAAIIRSLSMRYLELMWSEEQQN